MSVLFAFHSNRKRNLFIKKKHERRITSKSPRQIQIESIQIRQGSWKMHRIENADVQLNQRKIIRAIHVASVSATDKQSHSEHCTLVSLAN